MNALHQLIYCCLFLHGLPAAAHAASPPADSLFQFLPWIEQTERTFETCRQTYERKTAGPRQHLNRLNAALNQPEALRPETGYPLLLEKIRLEAQLQALREESDLKLLRLRYRKSIEMLKLLYEKILSMDHHFTSLRTNQQVLRISNPHEYPEFKELKTVLDERIKRKSGFTLPAVMETNPFLSAAFSIVGLALSSKQDKPDRNQLDKIACILDFTVRMHQDLHVVYYETEYLRDANLTLKKECETLFAECTRQIGYTIPLAICRDNDDWERLYLQLDHYIDNTAGLAAGADALAPKKARANLQFAIDRVVHYIEKYCAFVAQGNEYYKKFAKIVGNYSNETACSATLPETFGQLKNDIDTTLDKFNSAYNLPEIQGSRLKDLLYGFGD